MKPPSPHKVNRRISNKSLSLLILTSIILFTLKSVLLVSTGRMKLSIVLLLFIPLALATDGICAIYDTCGKKSIFGSALPCNSIDVPAQVPSSEDILLLQKVCGKDFPVDRVCCSPPQIKALESNLKKVDALIASCPACKKNFYDFFCDFSCSPNQSNFVKVTKTGISSDTHEEIVTEISQFVDYSYAKEFFNSCKNLKFLATNGFAMDLIGGGATNARDFLKFLGDEKPMLGGSPFQINFQYEEEDHYSLRGGDPKSCDDPEYKCACSDCSQSCPKLPHFRDFSKSCKVGPFPCFSFMILMLLLIAIVIGAGYHLYLRKQRKQQDVVDLHPTLIYPSRRRSSSSVSYVNVSSLSSFVSNTLNEINSKIEEYFQEISYACSSSPWPTIIITLFITFILCTGLRYLEFETDPVNLWVSPTEPALLEKQFFESKFGKFYRIEQLIVSSSGDNSSVLDWDVVQWWFEREKELQSLGGQELSSLCFKPLGETCAIESFAQYFQGDINYLNENNWETKLKSCTDSPVNCLPTFQQPLKKDLLFSGEENVLDSRAFVVTILLNNLELTEHSAIKYELSFIDWVETIVKPTGTKLGLNVDYLTESSLETELNKSTNTDINTIAISYLIMFIYASLALGGLQQKFTNFQQFFVDTRFQLGLSGIVIILLSVFASAGIFSFFGIKSTLIIVEVIPFLVLAVGIDNIFLIVNELQSVSQNPEYQSVILEKRVSLAVKKVGPSCLILAILQFSMFLIASNVDMPAVKNFALYSSGAILLNFILQMTTFIALLTIDQRRKEEGKMDIFWVRVKLISLPSDNTVTSSSNTDNTDILQESENWITAFISKTYAPFILDLPNKRKILSFFILLSGISLSLVPNISYGLDQRIALPADSHLVDYFNSVYSYLNVGPPIFFVTKNLDVTERSNQQRVCGKFSTCNEYSISNILQQEYKRGKKSTIAEPASVWIDDFLNWLNPDLDQCCRFKKTTIGDDKPEFCSVFAPDRQCQTCYENHSPPYSTDMRSFPEGDDFMFYFNQWIEQPSDPCPLGGKAPYSSSISITENNTIDASYFRTSHRPLRSQKDFIVAYKNSLRIVDEIQNFDDSENGSHLDLFAYSPFYVFFVQYETILKLTVLLLVAAASLIFAINTFLLGSIQVSLVVLLCVLMIIVNILGVMSLWSISLNAVSLVNLIICVGLAVEFTIHIAKAFTKSDEINATSKSLFALKTVGGSVFIGITMTKIIGISILAFTKSKIFEVYYFRMWFSLVFIAAIHALCLLPIMLSYCKVK